jgi:alkylation response protein AidB-like acyl-CoA dehydrogenase
MSSEIVKALLGGARSVTSDAPFVQAVAGGAAADGLGGAFAAGYGAAMRALFPAVGTRRAALCATEAGGAHPKAMRTVLEAGRVTGEKTFVTFGAQAELLLVVARAGEAGPLRVVTVDAAGPGVTFMPLPALRFAPDIPHAALRLDGAPAEVWPGDGYDDYLKPFRTVEDIHVYGAALAYLTAAGRRARWPAAFLAELGAVVAALGALAAHDPRARETHLVLAGALSLGRALIERADLAALPADERERFQRDRPLLDVAGTVRAKRLASAIAALGL